MSSDPVPSPPAPPPSLLGALLNRSPVPSGRAPRGGPSLFGALMKKQRQVEEQRAAAVAAASPKAPGAPPGAMSPSPVRRVSSKPASPHHGLSNQQFSGRSPSRISSADLSSSSSRGRYFTFSPPRFLNHVRSRADVDMSPRSSRSSPQRFAAGPLRGHAPSPRRTNGAMEEKFPSKELPRRKLENQSVTKAPTSDADEGAAGEQPPSFPPGHVIAEIVDAMLRSGKSLAAEKLEKTALRRAHAVKSVKRESAQKRHDGSASGNSDTEHDTAETAAAAGERVHMYSHSLRRRSGTKRRRRSIDEGQGHLERRSVSSSMDRASASAPRSPMNGFRLPPPSGSPSSSASKVARRESHSDVGSARKRKRHSDLTLPSGLPDFANLAAAANLPAMAGGNSDKFTEAQQRAWREYLGGLSLELTMDCANGDADDGRSGSSSASSRALAGKLGVPADQLEDRLMREHPSFQRRVRKEYRAAVAEAQTMPPVARMSPESSAAAAAISGLNALKMRSAPLPSKASGAAPMQLRGGDIRGGFPPGMATAAAASAAAATAPTPAAFSSSASASGDSVSRSPTASLSRSHSPSFGATNGKSDDVATKPSSGRGSRGGKRSSGRGSRGGRSGRGGGSGGGRGTRGGGSRGSRGGGRGQKRGSNDVAAKPSSGRGSRGGKRSSGRGSRGGRTGRGGGGGGSGGRGTRGNGGGRGSRGGVRGQKRSAAAAADASAALSSRAPKGDARKRRRSTSEAAASASASDGDVDQDEEADPATKLWAQYLRHVLALKIDAGKTEWSSNEDLDSVKKLSGALSALTNATPEMVSGVAASVVKRLNADVDGLDVIRGYLMSNMPHKFTTDQRDAMVEFYLKHVRYSVMENSIPQIETRASPEERKVLCGEIHVIEKQVMDFVANTNRKLKTRFRVLDQKHIFKVFCDVIEKITAP